MCPGVRLHEPDARGEGFFFLKKLTMGLLSHIIFLWSYRTAHSLVSNSDTTPWWRVLQPVRKRTKRLKYVYLQCDGEKICLMYFFQGDVSRCQREESKFPGQFLIGIIVAALLILNNPNIMPKSLRKTGSKPCQSVRYPVVRVPLL